MSSIIKEVLDQQLSIELNLDPPAMDWQPAPEGYRSGPYRLQVEPIVLDDDTALLHIHVSHHDGKQFALHNLKVSFQLSGVDIHGSWDSQASPVQVQRQQMMPAGPPTMRGDGTVAANQGVPLKMLLARSGQNRWLVGTVDQEDETRIDIRPDMRTGTYAITVQKLPAPMPMRPFGPPPPGPPIMKGPHLALQTNSYEERVYLSRAQVDWYDAVQSYVRTCDSITGFTCPSIPDAAYEPVYCTWYAVFKDVTAAWAEHAARTAADLGFRTFIVDDGWFTAHVQRFGYHYAGDWQVEGSRFPDMATHVRCVQDMGLKYVLWVAPFMVGLQSRTIQDMADHVIPNERGTFLEMLGFQNLCPRNAHVREHVQRTLLQLMDAYGLDGFKLDFVDSVALKPCPLGHAHDIETTGRAMHRALLDIYEALRAQNAKVLIEFRQAYANLAMRDCATMYRAFDVPFDFDANRWNITMTRAVAGDVPVHLDPAYWRPDELNENVARHMITAMFAVPMVSVDFERLPQEHLQIVKAWLDYYHAHKPLLAHGQFKPLMANGGLPALLLYRGRQAVLGVFDEAVPPIDLPPDTEELHVLNGGNEARVRLWIDGVQGAFEGEVFDLFHKSANRTSPRSLETLALEIPVGGYARLTRKAKSEF